MVYNGAVKVIRWIAGQWGMETSEAMPMETVLNDVRAFASRAHEMLPDADIWLYGSYAKGRATSASDIDVAVIVPDGIFSPRELMDRQIELFKAGFEINPCMEPCIFVEGTDLLGFVDREVKGRGIHIV